MKPLHLIFSLSLSLSILSSAESPTATPPTTAEAAQPKADLTFTINCDDTMKFDTTKIEAKTGQVIQIILKNNGKLPKAAMGHNLAILKPGTDLATFCMAGIANTETYLPSDDANKEKLVSATKLLGPGEEDTITFTAGEPGEYPFACTFPGHFGLMSGTLSIAAE